MQSLDGSSAGGNVLARLAERLEWFWWGFLLAASYPLVEIHGLQAGVAPAASVLQWATSLEEAKPILAAWRDHGLTAVVGRMQRWDFLLIVFYGLGLWGACRIGTRILAEKIGERGARLIPWMPVAAAALDAIENLALLRALDQAPGTEAYLLVALMVAAKLKWALLAFTAIFVLVSGWALLIRLMTGKATEAGTPGGYPEQAGIAEVINTELRVITGEPHGADRPASGGDTAAYGRAFAANLSGLAFSGGGIRSATFCLGILQALARAEKLSSFHYLSTVSGGGYIGSWFSAWIKRRAGNLDRVETALQAPGRELAEIRFLRSYSNYLTPRKGLFTVDTWTAVATYIRNLLLNLIILVGFVWAFFALLMLAVFHHGSSEAWGWVAGAAICVAAAAMTIGVTYKGQGELRKGFGSLGAWLDLARFFVHLRRKDALGATGAALDWVAKLRLEERKKLLSKIEWVREFFGFPAWLQSSGGVLALIVVPVFLTAFGGGIWVFAALSGALDGTWVRPIRILALVGILVWAAAFTGASLLSGRLATWKAALQIAAALAAVLSLYHYADTHVVEWTDFAVAILVPAAVIAIAGWSFNEFAGSRAGGLVHELVVAVYEFARLALAGTLGILVLTAVVVFFTQNVVLDWYDGYKSGTIIPVEDFSRFDELIRRLFAAIVEPPIVLAGIGAGAICGIGLAGNTFSDRGREWWSRLGGWIMIVLIGWIALVAIPLAVPGLMSWLRKLAGEGVGYGASAGWAALTSVLTLFARGGLAAGKSGGAVRAAVGAAPFLFAGGVVVLLANGFYGIALALNDFLTEGGAQPWVPSEGFAVNVVSGMMNLGGVSSGTWITLCAVSAFVAMLFALCVDINRFSLHDFYRNRLVRCYLGASNPARHERRGHITDVDSFTGLSPSDDLPMSSLRGQRPFHIVNTALNIVKTDRLAWQERKAASFVFTPLYSGYALPDPEARETRKCFRLTSSYARSPDAQSGVTLGTAMAISGAAVSPNMGRLTTPAFAALMTVLDLRLGCWMPNPGQTRSARLSSPPVAAQYLFYELLGLTDEKRSYVYLSDGGHFENLGVYELVRRRCRLILSIDAGADPERTFEDLGICIRRCQVDLGVKITIDVNDLERRSNAASAIAFAEGRIDYPEGTGRLIYVKPSIVKESEALAQVKSFRLLHGDFPHQPTTDQWFDESQFESYRALGELIGQLVEGKVP